MKNLLFLLVLLAPTLQAAVQEQKQTLSFTGLIQNQPALRSINWSIQQQGRETLKETRWSFTAKLPPGKYTVTASYNNQIITTDIEVKESQDEKSKPVMVNFNR